MWLFTIFFAATFAIGAENQGADIVRYIDEVHVFHKLNLNFEGVWTYYQNSEELDVLRTFLSYFLSIFTGNGYYLIIIYGIIFGFFFSRNMWFVLERIKGRVTFFTAVLIFCLFLIIPIWNLNGFRFWTAAHVFIYGLLPFIFERNKKRLIWCFLTPILFHYTFVLGLVPLIIYLLFGDKIKIYFFLFIISFFLSEFDISQFNTLIENYAPQTVVERSRGYRMEEKVEEFREGELNIDVVWYAKYYDKVLKWSIVALLGLIYWTSRRYIKDNAYLLRLLSFIFLFFVFANIMSSIPSGERFLAVGNLLGLSFMVLYFQNNLPNKTLLKMSKIVTPFLLFFIVISFRLSWYSVSWMTFLGNPITAVFTFGENISLNDIIKGL